MIASLINQRAGKEPARRNVPLRVFLGFALWLAFAGLRVEAAETGQPFVRVSPRDTRYLELSDGRPYIPIGLNLIHPNTREEDGLRRMEEWMSKLSSQGGNYIRVWLSSPFWDIERERSGVYDEAKAKRIDAMLALARRHGIRVKLTLEHFREMSDHPRQSWANKTLHLVANGGTATNLADFFDGQSSRDRFKGKLAWYAKRYGDDSTIYGWELWNEVNAVATGAEHYLPWTQAMLAELHRLFPRNLAMQSLGSYDSARVRDLYCQHSRLSGNDVAQVHRYLDLGASLDVCRGPVDILAADSVREILACQPGRPVILAESGAVEPRHAGPFKLYAKDKDGILLHDVLFAPFFAGAAGAGQIWHWDQYVDRNNLWHHFGRFAKAVHGLDPPAEGFQPVELKHARLRIYALQGRQTVMLWCRDARSTWKTELDEGIPPQMIEGCQIALAELLGKSRVTRVQIYDPWKDRWGEAALKDGTLALSAFSRSIVVKLVVVPR